MVQRCKECKLEGSTVFTVIFLSVCILISFLVLSWGHACDAEPFFETSVRMESNSQSCEWSFKWLQTSAAGQLWKSDIVKRFTSFISGTRKPLEYRIPEPLWSQSGEGIAEQVCRKLIVLWQAIRYEHCEERGGFFPFCPSFSFFFFFNWNDSNKGFS